MLNDIIFIVCFYLVSYLYDFVFILK